VTPFAVEMGTLKLSYDQVRAFNLWWNTLDKKVSGQEGENLYLIELTLIKLEG